MANGRAERFKIEHTARIERGKRLLSSMDFTNLDDTNYGFPMQGTVKAENREECDQMRGAIQAFLNTTPFQDKTDYEWSYYHRDTSVAFLNFKEAPCKELQKLLTPELGTDIVREEWNR